MRYFLLFKQNLEATKLVLAKVPKDALNVILKQYKCAYPEELSHVIQNTIKEYICFKEYAVNNLFYFIKFRLKLLGAT